VQLFQIWAEVREFESVGKQISVSSFPYLALQFVFKYVWFQLVVAPGASIARLVGIVP
jgi:hypothetical protein